MCFAGRRDPCQFVLARHRVPDVLERHRCYFVHVLLLATPPGALDLQEAQHTLDLQLILITAFLLHPPRGRQRARECTHACAGKDIPSSQLPLSSSERTR